MKIHMMTHTDVKSHGCCMVVRHARNVSEKSRICKDTQQYMTKIGQSSVVLPYTENLQLRNPLLSHSIGELTQSTQDDSFSFLRNLFQQLCETQICITHLKWKTSLILL
ncbi:hypothetical protein LOAG_11626 [Loa loa]|uniref:Uncharacterized protein n=1 Tax=Loa loa TaxID=7209 RepID=A0A1S0TML8_LOALO|nr:hypothetical protein LOAG_11626 [Loa loa]EFO16877.1 hypothetical protein LOAG_11626 [Loa loa]